MDKLREADAIVDSLGKAMQSGETGLRYVPALLVRVINEDMWRDRVITKTGERVHFDRFVDFVTTDPLEGLGADEPTLRRLCAGNAAAIDALNSVMVQPAHRPIGDKSLHCNDLSIDVDQGNSSAYALRKLRADAPELHQRVISGELSPHAAMVKAGFRRKTITIPVGDVEAIGRALVRYFTEGEIAELIELLNVHRP